jgi:hypothetical protein
MATLQDILSGNFPAAKRYAEGYAQMPSYLQDPYLGLSTSQVGNVTKGLLSKTQFEKAQEIASKNAETLLGLPKGNTAMDRAKAMGFDTTAYHGTSENFSAFDKLKRGSSTDEGWYGPGEYSAPSPEAAAAYAMSNFPMFKEGANILPILLKNPEKIINKSGYVSEYVTREPNQIRSQFAAFDPARMNESDILAGVMAIPVSGLLEQPKDKKKKK